VKVFALVKRENEDLISEVCENLQLDYAIVSSMSSPSIIPENSVFITDSDSALELKDSWLRDVKKRGCAVILIENRDTENKLRTGFDVILKARHEDVELCLKMYKRKRVKVQKLENEFVRCVKSLDFSQNFAAVVLDSKNRVVSCSKGFKNLKQAVEKVLQNVDLGKTGNKESPPEILKIRLHGKYQYFTWAQIPLNDGHLLILSDVTPVISENARLKEDISALKLAINLSEIPIVVHSEEAIISWNSSAEKVFGGNLHRKNIFDFFDQQSKGHLMRSIRSLKFSSKKTFTREAYMKVFDKKRVVSISSTAIKKDGEWIFISAIKDMTLEKKIFGLVKILLRIHEQLSKFKKRKFILQTAVKELKKVYKDVFIVSQTPDGFEIFTGDTIETADEVKNECVKRVMENLEQLIVEKKKHFKDCIYEEYHRDLEAFIYPLKVAESVIGYLVVQSEDKFSDEELKILEAIAVMVAHIHYKSELEEIKRLALKQLENNIKDFSRLIDRVKNPLAVISGYCEIHEDVASPTLIFSKIREETKKIIQLLETVEKSWEMSEKILKKVNREIDRE